MTPIIKICGITNTDDAVFCINSGTFFVNMMSGTLFLGFIFAESKRKIDMPLFEQILNDLKNRDLRQKVKIVAVTVNAEKNLINDIISAGADFIQFHGDESPDFTNSFNVQFIKVFRIGNGVTLRNYADSRNYAEMRNYADLRNYADSRNYAFQDYNCDYCLFDTYVENTYGGTGQILDIDSVNDAGSIVRAAGKKFFAAGGITPENILEVIEKTRPDGIDLSSGVEASPGIKSREKIRDLFEKLNCYHFR